MAATNSFSAMEVRVLQALRAGDLEVSQLFNRWGVNYLAPVRSLKSRGLIKYLSHETVSITHLGREKCPNRRRESVNQ